MTKQLFILLVILSSCTATRFDTYPGNKLVEFPQEVHGDYAIAMSSFPFNLFRKKDTAQFSIKADGIYALGESMDEPQLLSDSLVLSRMGKYFLLCQRVEKNPPQWTVDIWLHERNQIQAWYFDNTKAYAAELIKALQWKVLVKTADSTNWNAIAATPETVRHLMQANHPDSIVVFTPNDSVLTAIADRYVSREKPYIIKRVNKRK
jgi:hypothetical protein